MSESTKPAMAEDSQNGSISEHAERDVEAQQTDEKEPSSTDPNIVDFDGPNDPENPLNWPASRKNMNITLIALITFLSPFASTVISPGVADVMQEFHSTNSTLSAFVTTAYLLGYAFGPIVIAPLSEMYGRKILYIICAILFLIFNIACAVSNNLGALIVFRLLAGIPGSCPITIGAGSIADMVPAEKRGLAMATYILGPLLGPTLAPVVGGYLAPAKGWRWTFWLIVIVSAIPTVLTVFMSESYAYVILKWKTQRLRKETGNRDLRSALDTGRTATQLFAFSIIRPLKMLLLSPIVFLLSLYAATVYGYLYICFTTFPRVFESQYRFPSSSAGLAYLGIGIGSLVGVVLCGALSDRLVRYLVERSGGVPKPEYRLPLLGIGALSVPVGLFWYAWTAERKEHWILPIIGTAFLGLGLVVIFMAIQTYLVDAYTSYAASANAAAMILRCLVGAFLPLAGNGMFDALGVGWGVSVLGFIATAFIPVPFVFYVYGERIRNSNLFDVKF